MITIIHLPNSRSYWNEMIGNNLIRNIMSVNKFKDIRKNLHFNNNKHVLPADHHNHDRF